MTHTTTLKEGMRFKNKQGATLHLSRETTQDDALGSHTAWWLKNNATGNRRSFSRAELVVAIYEGHLTQIVEEEAEV